MAYPNKTSQSLHTLKINKVPDEATFEQMQTDNLVNANELYLVEGDGGSGLLVTLNQNNSNLSANHTYTEIDTAFRNGNVILVNFAGYSLACEGYSPFGNAYMFRNFSFDPSINALHEIAIIVTSENIWQILFDDEYSIPTATSDLNNDSGFITSESDPIFSASAAHGITSTDIANWNGKISEPVSEGTNGQVLMTNGSGTRTWGNVSTADEKIKLTSQSTSGNYPLIFGPTSITSNSTYQGYYNTGITINPNTKAITATTFVGALTGTASGNLTSSSTLDASKLSGTIPSGVKAATQDSSDNSEKIATTAFVKNNLGGLSGAMMFKGTLGTGGTITTLPTAAEANTGFTYKVITDGTYASIAAKVGDLFISNGSEWIIVPSGDETFVPTLTSTSDGQGHVTLGVTVGPMVNGNTMSF